jgi:hypothetical protein
LAGGVWEVQAVPGVQAHQLQHHLAGVQVHLVHGVQPQVIRFSMSNKFHGIPTVPSASKTVIPMFVGDLVDYFRLRSASMYIDLVSVDLDFRKSQNVAQKKKIKKICCFVELWHNIHCLLLFFLLVRMKPTSYDGW